MKRMRKGNLVIIGILILLILAIISIILMNVIKPKEQKIQMENGTATETVRLKDIEFSEITNSYLNGITTIRAKMHNNASTAENIEVEILLKDASGNIIGEMRQKVENVEVGREKIFVTGITGNYSNAKEIEMKVVE